MSQRRSTSDRQIFPGYNKASPLDNSPMPFRRYAYYFSSIFTLLTGFRKPLRIATVFLGAKTEKNLVVQLRRNGLKFKVRGKMDIWSLKETLIDRFYERFGFSVQNGWTIVDIGGGIGDYSIFAANRRDKTRVLAFEPFPESHHILQDNLNLNEIHNVELSVQAVASQEGKLQFASGMVDPLSRQTSTISEGSAGNTLFVEAVSLETVLKRIDFGHIDLIKLDCEGAEYDILLNSPASVLEKIDRIVMEYHDGVTPFNHLDLVECLTKNGYQVEFWKNYAHANIGYMRAKRTSEGTRK